MEIPSNDHSPVTSYDANLNNSENMCVTLPGLLRRCSTPVRPRLLAYLLALLFVCILGAYETRRVDVWTDSIVPIHSENLIPLERQSHIPDPDGIRWVVYAQESLESGSVRLNHWTNHDNYPEGRYVGWSSPPMWWLEGLAYLRHVISGEDIICATSDVASHYNTFLWVFATSTMGLMCVFAYGWRGAVILPVLYSTLAFTKYGVFSPDHHVWILLSGLGTLICITAPFFKESQKHSRLWFAGAAVFCAFGFWISAPSQALVVIGIFVGFLFIPQNAAQKVDGGLWRFFGEVAAALSLLACWWEFRPAIPFRVELNGPIYAAGILVAGIWFWQMHVFAASGRRWDSLNQRALLYSALGLIIIIIPLIIYAPYCFSLSDPFFVRWESQIAEEQPVGIFDFILSHAFLFLALSSALVGLYLRRRKHEHGLYAALVIVSGLAFTYGYFGISSRRFTETVIACVVLINALSLPREKHDLSGWITASFLLLLGFGAVHESSVSTRRVELYGTPDLFAVTTDIKLISNKLIKIDGGAKGAVLIPSYEGNLLNYFSDLPVYGTAYWENNHGLQFIARIYFLEMDAGETAWTPVRRMLNKGKTRYIVMPKDFTYASSYMIYGKNRINDPQYTFAYYLLHTDKDKFAPWLKLEIDDDKFRVFSIVD